MFSCCFFFFLFFLFLVLLSALCCLFFKGCPVAGCYGSTDSFPCPDVNCHYCHKETGTCQMCQPGYIGPRCELSKLYVFKLYKTSFFKLFLIIYCSVFSVHFLISIKWNINYVDFSLIICVVFLLHIYQSIDVQLSYKEKENNHAMGKSE